MSSANYSFKGIRILAYFFFLVVGTYYTIIGTMAAAGFLVPITVSIMLALICIPLARKFEKWGMGRGFSSLLCVLTAFITFLSIFALISLQISQFSEKWPEIKQKAIAGIEQVEDVVKTKTGFSFQQDIDKLFPNTAMSEGDSSSQSKTSKEIDSNPEQSTEGSGLSIMSSVPDGVFSKVGGFVVGFFGFLGSSTLSMIYLFFLLYYRSKIKSSILRFFSKDHQSDVKEVLTNVVQLALDFLVGRLLLILFLGVIYSIGLSLSGIENAILISILAALLSLIPYVGNVIGIVLAMFMAAVSGGELSMYIGVAVTYFITQFTESYILQPFVVGGKVNINPLITIVVVVLGGTIWGIAGMILAIPLTGIFKIIFDAVPVLEPVGYFLGEEGLDDDDEEPSKLAVWGKKIWSKISGK